MISLSEIGGLYISTPSNIKDARTKAFMYACDKQIKKLLERAEKTKVWCNVESVDEKYLDYMAADCRALFYSSSFAPDIKRDIIENSQYWYSKLGTSHAIKEILKIVFQAKTAELEEWYEYSGEPYHFRIVSSIDFTKTDISEFLKYINEVKNARSILDCLVSQQKRDSILYAGTAEDVFVRVEMGIMDGNKFSEKNTNLSVLQQTEQLITIEYSGGKSDG